MGSSNQGLENYFAAFHVPEGSYLRDSTLFVPRRAYLSDASLLRSNVGIELTLHSIGSVVLSMPPDTAEKQDASKVGPETKGKGCEHRLTYGVGHRHRSVSNAYNALCRHCGRSFTWHAPSPDPYPMDYCSHGCFATDSASKT